MLVVLLATVAVYWPVTGFEFVGWDDVDNVSVNPQMNPVTGESWRRFWTEPYRNMYIPLSYSLWAAIAQVGRSSAPDADGVTLNPYVFHTANLALHLLAAWLVHGILMRLLDRPWAACAGAVVFAVHPLQVEPVAWVTGLRDVLGGVLALAAIRGFIEAMSIGMPLEGEGAPDEGRSSRDAPFAGTPPLPYGRGSSGGEGTRLAEGRAGAPRRRPHSIQGEDDSAQRRFSQPPNPTSPGRAPGRGRGGPATEVEAVAPGPALGPGRGGPATEVGAVAPGPALGPGRGGPATEQGVACIDGMGRWGWWTLATAAFIAAMLAKPASVVVVGMAGAMLLLWDRRRWKAAWPLGIWVALAGFFAVLTARVQSAAATVDVPIATRLWVAADAVGFYLRQLVWPRHLAIDYGRSPKWLMANGSAGLAIGATVVVIAALVVGRRHRMVWAATGIFLTVLAPVSGIVKFDFQVFSTVADRYAYLAMLGPALLLTAAMARWPKPGVAVGVGLALAAYGARAYAATRAWRDSGALFAAALEVNPTSLAANNASGQMLAKAGDFDGAFAAYRRALGRDPDYAITHYNFANALLLAGGATEAVAEYELAMRGLDYPFIANNYSVALVGLGRFDEAEAVLRKALVRWSGNTELHTNLGQLLAIKGAVAEGMVELRTAIRLDPTNRKAAENLAKLERRVK